MFAAHFTSADTDTLLRIVGLICVAAAAYCAYLRNVVAVALLVFVAVVSFVVTN